MVWWDDDGVCQQDQQRSFDKILHDLILLSDEIHNFGNRQL